LINPSCSATLRDGAFSGAIHAMNGTAASTSAAAERAARASSVANPCPCSAAAIL
jgi:hypothetical protein